MQPSLEHAAELRRCLEELDIVGVRRLWQHIAAHLPQPVSNDEALCAMHMARKQMAHLAPRLREYSVAWLAERDRRRIACAVGISVKAASDRPSRQQQAANVRDAMQDSVLESYKAGLDLDKDAPEVRRRMHIARSKA